MYRYMLFLSVTLARSKEKKTYRNLVNKDPFNYYIKLTHTFINQLHRPELKFQNLVIPRHVDRMLCVLKEMELAHVHACQITTVIHTVVVARNV